MKNKQLAREILKVTRYGYLENQLEAIEKLLNENRPEQLQQHSVMQAEGSDGVQGAAVGQRSGGKSVCVDKGRKKDGPCKYPIGTCEWCANIY